MTCGEYCWGFDDEPVTDLVRAPWFESCSVNNWPGGHACFLAPHGPEQPHACLDECGEGSNHLCALMCEEHLRVSSSDDHGRFCDWTEEFVRAEYRCDKCN